MGIVAIPLTLGMHTTIDAADLPLVAPYKWHASKSSNGRYYARGYMVVDGRWTKVYLHRFLTGAPRGVDVDHINSDTLDNTRSNIRVCTHAENSRNRRVQVGERAGVKGVWFDKSRQKYQAYINVGGKRISLGRFRTEAAAIEAYNAAATEHHGEFAKLIP